MKAKQIKILLGTAVGLIVMLVTVGNGCSKHASFETNMSSIANTGDNNPSGAGPTEGDDFIPGAKTASVVYAKQALDQLTSCAGVAVPSDETNRMYEAKQSSISAYGDANSVTAPMMMAITNISGEICNDLLKQEDTAKRIFVGWNLAGTSAPAASLVGDSISRMAISCWQKNESSFERDTVMRLVASIPDGAGASRKKALVLCTAMLSSLNSLLN